MEIYVFVGGAKKSLTQLAAESGTNYDTLLRRYKAGVPGDQLVPKTGAGGTNGKDGKDGEDGATFLPSVDADGNISWTNNKGLPNPASVNIKGPAGPAGEGGSLVKLWTNASPDSDFASQSIYLDLSSYQFVEIEVSDYPTLRVPVGQFVSLSSIGGFSSTIAGTAVFRKRELQAGSNSIHFTDAFYKVEGASATGTVLNRLFKPLAIYGVRGVG